MKLLSWGANTYGQLGQGVKSEQCILPAEIKTENILDLDSVIYITGGGGHTLILTKDGKVFACGLNTKGQLGLNMNLEHLVLTEITSLVKYHIAQICCGWDSSLAVTNNGELLVWGSNAYGQLGLPKAKILYTSFPLKVPLPAILCVASGLRHTAMLSKEGKVFICGSGRKGQLGLVDGTGKSVLEVDHPTEIPDLADVCDIACGQHHTVVLTTSGRLFAWGENKHGQLGVSPTLHPTVIKPMEIQTLPCEIDSGSKVFSGWTHVAILTDGKIINWGRNTYGQLGCHEYQRPLSWKPHIMANIGHVKDMAIGSEHNIALLDSGQIVSWGWNEHGNCGTGTEEDIRQPTVITQSIHQLAILLGCGAGHNFAIVV